MSQTRRRPHEEREQYVSAQRAVQVHEGSRDCQIVGWRAGMGGWGVAKRHSRYSSFNFRLTA